jgi:hypothetical protein
MFKSSGGAEPGAQFKPVDGPINDVAINGMTPAVETIQALPRSRRMEHVVQHTRKYIEMLATVPRELVQPVNVAVEARHYGEGRAPFRSCR